MISRAAVLAGGGVAGIAWLVGVLTELAGRGVDVGAADLLVGTSAGSAAAAQLGTGQLAAAADLQLSERTAELAAHFDMQQFLTAMQQAAGDAADRQEAARRIANVPLVNAGADPAARRAAVAARLPQQQWPRRPMLITAVDRASGARVSFDRGSDVPLVDAVLASCAVPGIWPPVAIGDATYVDGGVWSSTNADLAAGHDRTLILVPSLVDDHLRSVIALERDLLSESFVLAADDGSLAAFGPNPLDPGRRAASYAAGRTQAAGAAAEIGRFWTAHP